jgi:hypothetical protein
MHIKLLIDLSQAAKYQQTTHTHNADHCFSFALLHILLLRKLLPYSYLVFLKTLTAHTQRHTHKTPLKKLLALKYYYCYMLQICAPRAVSTRSGALNLCCSAVVTAAAAVTATLCQ